MSADQIATIAALVILALIAGAVIHESRGRDRGGRCMRILESQLARIEASETSAATKALARRSIPLARAELGSFGVFWDAEDDTISFESDAGVIIVGGSTREGDA